MEIGIAHAMRLGMTGEQIGSVEAVGLDSSKKFQRIMKVASIEYWNSAN